MPRRRDARRKAEFDAAVAETQANLRDMRRMEAADNRGLEAVFSVADAVTAELDRRAAEAEAGEVERFRHPDGACPWCGLSHAMVTTGEPDWHTTSIGVLCGWCKQVHDRARGIEPEARILVTVDLLGVGRSMRSMGDKRAFAALRVWFREHDAEASVRVEDRFSFVDLDELRATYERLSTDYDPVPEPEIKAFRDKVCETCGGVERYVIYGQRGGSLSEPEALPGDCVDCSVVWAMQAGGTLPDWWVRRKGRKLPQWAKPLVEASA